MVQAEPPLLKPLASYLRHQQDVRSYIQGTFSVFLSYFHYTRASSVIVQLLLSRFVLIEDPKEESHKNQADVTQRKMNKLIRRRNKLKMRKA